MKIILLGIAAIIATSSAFATITGKELLNNCVSKSSDAKEPTRNNRDFCVGYVAGFLDTYVLTVALHRVNPNERHFCLGNKGISYSQAIQVTVNYLQKHPKELNDTARNLLVKAFAERYPCQSNYQPRHDQRYDQNQTDQYQDNRYQDI